MFKNYSLEPVNVYSVSALFGAGSSGYTNAVLYEFDIENQELTPILFSDELYINSNNEDQWYDFQFTNIPQMSPDSYYGVAIYANSDNIQIKTSGIIL